MEVKVPPSKSHSIRALYFGCDVENLLDSPDIRAMQEALKGNHIIDAGNSGQVLRFMGARAALSDQLTSITGDASIRTRRPVKPLLDALSQMGVWVNSTPMYPVQVKGPWLGGEATISTDDSQPLSALLMAAPFTPEGVRLHVPHVGELPWVKLTLDWLKRMNLKCEHDNFKYFEIPGGQKLQKCKYTVPGDYSSAAFPMAAALIQNKPVTLLGLDPHDVQGDRLVFDLFETEWKGSKLCIPPQRIVGREIDMEPIIDALPVLAVIALFADGPTRLYNAAVCRTKESDRIAAIATELKKMGASLEQCDDGLMIYPSELYGGSVDSHNDHRIAMALSVASLCAKGKTSIAGMECVTKSYPEFASSVW